MKQLEMIKAMAKLEGVKGHIFDGLFIRDDVNVGALCFNPITDLALNCVLRDKYKAEVAYWLSSVCIDEESCSGQAFFKNQSVGSAVIECILKSKGKWVE